MVVGLVQTDRLRRALNRASGLASTIPKCATGFSAITLAILESYGVASVALKRLDVRPGQLALAYAKLQDIPYVPPPTEVDPNRWTDFGVG